MKHVWTIARREFQSFFDSLSAYILLVLFLSFTGIFTWIYGNDIFMYGQASLQMFFNVAYISLFLLIPALTMKSIAEERKTGTIEMLLTKPITVWQLLLGKYLAILMLVAVCLALTLPYYISVSCLGNIDHGAVICGYIGLLLMCSAYIAIGLFASSITGNQIVSFLISISIGILFHFIFDMMGEHFSGTLGHLANSLNMNTHFESIARGVIDSKDIIYFISITFAAIYVAKNQIKRNTSKLNTALTLAIVVAINIVGSYAFFRLDFTGDKRYTLSNATLSILEKVDEPITVKAYFSEDLPAEVAKGKQDFKDLLTEYHSTSSHMIEFEFINPASDDITEQEAMDCGIFPIMINVREKDQIKQQKAYMGAVVMRGKKSEIIPFVRPNMSVEYELSSAIRKLSQTNRPTVAILQGHGEPLPEFMPQLLSELEVLNNITTATINGNIANLNGINTLLIIAPTDSIPQSDFDAIDQFMANGGRVAIAINRVNVNLDEFAGFSQNTGLETWLQTKDITVDNKFAIDSRCATVGIQQQQPNGFTTSTQMIFPYIPIITQFADNAITTGLEQIQFQFVSPVVYTGDSLATFTTLVTTSNHAATLNVPHYIDMQKEWTFADFPLAEVPVAGLLEGNIAGANTKMVIFGDGDFVINASPRQKLMPDNISLMANAIDYLTDDTGLIELRTKGITSRPLDDVDNQSRTIIKWINVLLPIVLAIFIGILRKQQQRNLRIKRMEEGYV